MKNFTLKGVIPMLILFATFQLNAQNNVITLSVASTGSEGDTKYTDESPLLIDDSGNVSMDGNEAYFDWSVSGTVNLTDANNSNFSVLFGGMNSVNTEQGDDFGKMLNAAGIDRSNSGEIGIRGGSSNGVDAGEGMYFGLNLTGVPSSIKFQITGINVKYLGSGEAVTLVNLLNPSQYTTAGITGEDVNIELSNGSGMVDISNLKISIAGGESEENMLSCFQSGTTGNIRIVGLELTVLENSSSSVDGLQALNDNIIIAPNPFTDELNIHVKPELQNEYW